MEAQLSNDWQTVFLQLKAHHDNAYRIIENAIQLDEIGEKVEALAQYEVGLETLDKALNINIECRPRPDMTWEKACCMIEKMKKTRKEVLCRISESQKSSEPNVSSSKPPSYEEAMLNSNSTNNGVTTPSRIITYEQLGAALQNLKVETGAQTANILYTHPNVRIYFISCDGTVNATSEPDTLNIVELQDEGVERPRAYLQVGDWIYPLVPGVSPCLKTEYGAFILPDLHSPEEGAAVGIILPEEADASVHELLSDILCGIVEAAPPIQLKRAGRQRRDMGFSISQGIVKGAQYISHGLIGSAERAGQFMNYGTPKLIEHIEPGATPAPINPKVETGLRVAKNVTQGAVAVTGYIASRVGAATMALGRYLAPHVQRQGTRLLSTTFNYTEQEATNKVEGVLQVAAGAVEGFSTVYDGLENAAKILGNSLTTNTVKIVQHKYGQPAGAVTGDTLYTVGNVFVAGSNIRHLTPKGLVKATAKETGKAVVQDYRASLQDASGNSQFKTGSSSEVD